MNKNWSDFIRLQVTLPLKNYNGEKKEYAAPILTEVKLWPTYKTQLNSVFISIKYTPKS